MRAGQASNLSGATNIPVLLSDDTQRTATVERIPDPQGFDLDAAWDAALARVKAQFKPKQFQMFDLYVLKEWPVKEVARALGVTATHLYVMKHRVSAALKKEMLRLEPDKRSAD